MKRQAKERFSTIQYNTTVKRHVEGDTQISRFSTIQYNTTVKQA